MTVMNKFSQFGLIISGYCDKPVTWPIGSMTLLFWRKFQNLIDQTFLPHETDLDKKFQPDKIKIVFFTAFSYISVDCLWADTSHSHGVTI